MLSSSIQKGARTVEHRKDGTQKETDGWGSRYRKVRTMQASR